MAFERIQFSPLADLAESLDFAWQRFHASQGEMELPDVIDSAEVLYQWPKYRSYLVEKIDSNAYYPGYVEVVDLPKDELTVRPLARLTLEDRLFYEAHVFSMAIRIDSEISRSVYSYRWSIFKNDLRRPIGSWVNMQKTGRKIQSANPSFLLAKTDVSSFYENVDIDVLIQELSNLTENVKGLARLRSFLQAFQQMNHVWGLPQGSDASGILANLYLVPVDRVIQATALRHLRYSDDIYIFGPEKRGLRECLLEVNRTLRGRHLSMSGHKTKIMRPVEAATYFGDMEKDAIRYKVDIASDMALAEVRDFFARATKKDSDRDIRFSLNQFKHLNSPFAMDWVVQNFERFPHMAQDFVAYLEFFPICALDMVHKFCTKAISERTMVSYPYAELHIFGLMMRQRIFDKQVHGAAWDILRNRNEETFLREYAARYVGLNAQPGDGALLRQEFRRDPSTALRRVLLVAIYETRHDSTAWFDQAAGAVPDLRWICDYLKSKPKIPLPPPYRRVSSD
ncbi:RNA-directed DNA polymerase [Spirillospora sp. CA-294931]|uniref:RNA-directed DNA polymerase n=1 Tax=Spirillospora sp. CA-294931 TaxID=3240042 RepID=UPI003D8AB86E